MFSFITTTFQLARLGLCEKLLVAIELSGRINDTQLGTQAIIQTYGLLAPLIHHNIMCYPALKVRTATNISIKVLNGTYYLANTSSESSNLILFLDRNNLGPLTSDNLNDNIMCHFTIPTHDELTNDTLSIEMDQYNSTL